ncbi:hypothetical protein [Gymnodinialimonas hymeniacidonis]|uniref:hypothetical protein n=1 Tax=Gymnodinialimonas hymeniacidonis TaxID=3126508 RepID=UPI0034C6D4D5
MKRVAPFAFATGAALLLASCAPTSTYTGGPLDQHTLISARDGEPTTLTCTAGPDSRQRAQQALAVLDAGFTQLEETIRARTEASFNGGADFNSAAMIRLSQRTGEQLAQRIDSEYGCFLLG